MMLVPSRLAADDWPQWRGPDRNGISGETGWMNGWAQGSAPKVAWRAAVGKGHSAVSVRGGRAFTMGWDGEHDSVFCFDAVTGRLNWKQSYPCTTILQWPGPRATPTVHGNTVFTLGQHGQLRAWDTRTGQPRWQRDLPEDYNPDVDYGFAWSPLVEPAGEKGDGSLLPERPEGCFAQKTPVPFFRADDSDGDLLILNAGSRGLAIRARDGSIAWGDDRKKGACVSAVPFTHDGRRCVLIVNVNEDRSAVNLVGIEPRTGRELWRWNGWKEQWGAMGVDPVVHEGRVFLTSAQEYRQAARFTITGDTLRQDWSTNRVAGYTGSAVLLGGHLYMVDSNGILKCIDWNTGKERWAQRGFDERGTLTAADGKLIIQTGASGKLVIAAADPAGYRELRQAKVFDGAPETFTVPVLANGRVYCRSYAGELVCLDLSREK